MQQDFWPKKLWDSEYFYFKLLSLFNLGGSNRNKYRFLIPGSADVEIPRLEMACRYSLEKTSRTNNHGWEILVGLIECLSDHI